MPHIILEYAESLISKEQVPQILDAIHQAIAKSNIFKANQVKTRAYAFQFFTQAGKPDPYIHIQARIKSGRDADNKKQFSQVIIEALKPFQIEAAVATVEVIDMDRDSYNKHSF
ncbi:MAG: hypothetical protein ISR69_09335 [Gammaproteobacteria bacterium]|nr:hypothetical protein [Gammaproteobacteria bacterium]